MNRGEAIRARIEARVPALAGRLESAAEFGQLVENNRLPQHTPAGFVLPGALVGGIANAAAGLFTQSVAETAIVVLVVRQVRDALGGAAVAEAAPIVVDVIKAVAGWGPDDAPGVFTLGRAELVGSQDQALVYQIDFTLDDQLRITP
ncbi:MAG: hypothetical protein IT472_08840 [Thermomonas sp.]|uniref:phage tail terminator protein n=1 Tax=Thermomonas sp. TaxID=1971895 RepID=UPI002624AE46|nr:hypothetical protein [Thermomonas sp.]MCC7097271.1 hypothetical protein [Thermomonas sp.]